MLGERGLWVPALQSWGSLGEGFAPPGGEGAVGAGASVGSWGSLVTHNQGPEELPYSSMREGSRQGMGKGQARFIGWSQPVQQQDCVATAG